MNTINPWPVASAAGLLIAVPYAAYFVNYYSETPGYYPSCIVVSSTLVAVSFLLTFVLTYAAASSIAQRKLGQ